MARKWYHLRAVKSSSPHPDVRAGVSELQRKLSTDPAWLAAEEAENALMKAPQLATYTVVKAWMDVHKRHPVRERGGEEGDMAWKWNRLRFRGLSQLPEVRKGVQALEERVRTDPDWLKAEETEKARRGQSFRSAACNRVVAWVETSRRRPVEGRGDDEDVIARAWRDLLSKRTELLPEVRRLVDSLLIRFREPEFI